MNNAELQRRYLHRNFPASVVCRLQVVNLSFLFHDILHADAAGVKTSTQIINLAL